VSPNQFQESDQPHCVVIGKGSEQSSLLYEQQYDDYRDTKTVSRKRPQKTQTRRFMYIIDEIATRSFNLVEMQVFACAQCMRYNHLHSLLL